jgi:hypothetical protein
MMIVIDMSLKMSEKRFLAGNFGIIFSRKQIQRVMRKHHIFCPIRKRNSYKKMQQANQEHHKTENILSRNFKQSIPGKFLLTDITYLKFGQRKTAYLSTIKDSCTNEILAYNLSEYMNIQIVINTFKKIKNSPLSLFTKYTLRARLPLHKCGVQKNPKKIKCTAIYVTKRYLLG